MSAMLVAACSADEEERPPSADTLNPGVDLGGDASAAHCDDIGDVQADAQLDFEADIVPILGLSCNIVRCHGGIGTTGPLQLGALCEPGAAADECLMPEAGFSPAVLDTVYANLMAPSNATADLARVQPGAPARSFVLYKLAGCQQQLPEDVSCPNSCGSVMPPGGAFRNAQPERYEVIARWIAAGAPR